MFSQIKDKKICKKKCTYLSPFEMETTGIVGTGDKNKMVINKVYPIPIHKTVLCPNKFFICCVIQ